MACGDERLWSAMTQRLVKPRMRPAWYALRSGRVGSGSENGPSVNS